METATIRIPEDKKNLLKAISSLEKRKMNDIIVGLIDEYIERHKETFELLSIPGLYDQVTVSSREFKERRSVPLRDVRKKMER